LSAQPRWRPPAAKNESFSARITDLKAITFFFFLVGMYNNSTIKIYILVF